MNPQQSPTSLPPRSSHPRVTISGTGMCVPDKVVTNDDLAKLMDTSDDWITQRSGIKERRHVVEGETPSSLAETACRRALAMANLDSRDVDLLIVATLSPEHYFPGTASFLQARLGLGTTPAFDVRVQCSGFIYAMNIGQNFVAMGQYRRVLVVGVEVHSRALDFTNRGRDVAVLFGDGAAAVVLEPSLDPERGIMATTLHSDGRHADKLWVQYPTLASAPYISSQIVEEGLVSPRMDGKFVFKNAVQRLPEVVAETLQKVGLQARDIDLFLFHQANLRINEAVALQLGLRPDQVVNNIDRFGNCSAASIPLLLDESVRSGRVKPGQVLCMATFGSGFTWACSVIRW